MHRSLETTIGSLRSLFGILMGDEEDKVRQTMKALDHFASVADAHESDRPQLDPAREAI